MRQLIQDIHKGKNLESNLKAYKELVVQNYLDYAVLELTFSSFTMMQEITEEKQELAKKEKATVELICHSLKELGRGNVDVSLVQEKMKNLRKEITAKMDLFTAYTDRLICYEYVLNRMELKHVSTKELNKKMAEFDEESYLQELSAYLFGNKDQSVVRDKLRLVMGQIPVHMTKNKLFEKMGEALTLYKGGDRQSFDDFLYMLRTSAMLYEPKQYVGEYADFENILTVLSEADYKNMDETTYIEMTQKLEQGVTRLHEIPDFYYTLQKVVHNMYALCLILPYATKDGLLKECSSIWCSLAEKEYQDEMLLPLEGKIEKIVEKTSYLESILQEITDSYDKEIEALGFSKFFEEFILVSKLMSDSLFIDLERVSEDAVADSDYVKQQTEQLLEELSVKFSEVSHPVKRAIMGQVVEKLPIMFQNSKEVIEYIQINLFGCQDKAEKCVVMSMLWDLMQEDKEWS